MDPHVSVHCACTRRYARDPEGREEERHCVCRRAKSAAQQAPLHGTGRRRERPKRLVVTAVCGLRPSRGAGRAIPSFHVLVVGRRARQPLRWVRTSSAPRGLPPTELRLFFETSRAPDKRPFLSATPWAVNKISSRDTRQPASLPPLPERQRHAGYPIPRPQRGVDARADRWLSPALHRRVFHRGGGGGSHHCRCHDRFGKGRMGRPALVLCHARTVGVRSVDAEKRGWANRAIVSAEVCPYHAFSLLGDAKLGRQNGEWRARAKLFPFPLYSSRLAKVRRGATEPPPPHPKTTWHQNQAACRGSGTPYDMMTLPSMRQDRVQRSLSGPLQW